MKKRFNIAEKNKTFNMVVMVDFSTKPSKHVFTEI